MQYGGKVSEEETPYMHLICGNEQERRIIEVNNRWKILNFEIRKQKLKHDKRRLKVSQQAKREMAQSSPNFFPRK